MTKMVLGIAAGMLTLATCRPVVQAAESQATITLCLRDKAGVDSPELNFARQSVARIYEAAGVRVEWKDRWQPDAIVVAIVAGTGERAIIHDVGAGDEVLGFAPEGGRTAFVFADRVKELRSKLFNSALGLVMAHEIGHVLMPGQGHSADGIMQARMDPRQPRSAHYFTSAQAASIRAAVRN